MMENKMVNQGFFQAIFTTVSRWYKLNLQLSFKTQSSIFYQFTNSFFITIVEVLFLINYPLEKHFKKEYFLLRFPAM